MSGVNTLTQVLAAKTVEVNDLKVKSMRLKLRYGGLAMFVGLNMWVAMWVMLGLGAAHDQWHQVPALGYWTTYLIVMGLAGIASSWHGGLKFRIVNDQINIKA